MPQSRWFRFGYGILLIFLIIWVGTKISFVFQPVFVLVQTLFFPFLLAGVLFYVLRPLVLYLESKKLPRAVSILLIYIAAGGIVTLLVYLLGPILQRQVNSLVQNSPAIIESVRQKIFELQQNPWFNRFPKGTNMNLETIFDNVSSQLSNTLSIIGMNIVNFIAFIANIITIFVTVPFILFYMLKEGEKAPQQILRLLAPMQRKNGKKILGDLDIALSSYIQGQVLVSVCVGIMLYIGYLIIGIDYSLILAIVAMFTNVIPFLGPVIAIIPALVVAMLDSPFMIVKVLIVMVIAQQIEGNIISPQIMRKQLAIHPLTIISLLLVAGSLGGVLGLILAVPVYAVVKVIVQHIYRLWRLRRKQETKENILP
ncbi:AI-2E family transporter [Bacillus sp. 165]|uniref:AI-2E family transporter n=1 Tax=Bacillus sp. 165 TaxID=1529117 RepID=UPI001ADB426B|nr:AI-2E family transporter [Bacillus sp. 165]MBO9128604.1 AI-2E family transporter [Bacillus sp. 165]